MSPETPKVDNITKYHSYLIGLLGHVDCGKTAIARQLTEIVSTSGLDAHPQSKERGITIDLGFTSFIEDDLLITLVDAPGHADLIRSVVASGRIINGAIVVLDGREGIQVQTAEHMVILELLNTNLFFSYPINPLYDFGAICFKNSGPCANDYSNLNPLNI